MPTTLASNMFIPEVATEVATAKFPEALAMVTGAGRSGVVQVIPQDQLPTEGSLVKFPRFDPLGDFEDMVEDTGLTIETLTTSEDTAPVIAGGKAIEATDFASLQGRGDISEEFGRQVAFKAASYLSSKLVVEAATTALVTDVSAAATTTLVYDNIVDALFDNWNEHAFDDIGGLFANPAQARDLMKSDDFKRYDFRGPEAGNARGWIGEYMGIPIYVSSQLPTTVGTPNTATAIILKRGALGVMFQRQLLVETDRDIVKKNTVISADIRFAVHLMHSDPQPAIRLITTR